MFNSMFHAIRMLRVKINNIHLYLVETIGQGTSTISSTNFKQLCQQGLSVSVVVFNQ